MVLTKLVSVLSLVFICSYGSSNSNVTTIDEYVQMYVTQLNGDDKFTRYCNLDVSQASSNDISTDYSFILNESEVFQKIYGYGATLTQSAAYLLTQYKNHSSDGYWTLLAELFDSTLVGDTVIDDTANYRVLRLPISSTDFVIGDFYSYDDLTDDYDLANVSLNIDTDYLIPILMDIVAIAPDIEIMASTWSPPVWLKSSSNLDQQTAFTQGHLINDTNDTYEIYAKFLTKIIELYNFDYGITISYLSIQNEPLHCGDDSPASCMSTEQQISLVKLLGPMLAENQYTTQTKLVIFDHNWNQTWYPLAVLSDSDAYDYIQGSAFHCYGGNVSSQSDVYNEYPDKEIYFTECTSSGDINFEDDLEWDVNNVFMGSINNWASMVLSWNLILDENNGPHNGGCTNCNGLITMDSKYKLTYNENYYGIKHFSKFITGNYGSTYRIKSWFNKTKDNTIASSCLDGIAMKNTEDGSFNIILKNFCDENIKVTIIKSVNDTLNDNGHNYNNYEYIGSVKSGTGFSNFSNITNTTYQYYIVETEIPKGLTTFYWSSYPTNDTDDCLTCCNDNINEPIWDILHLTELQFILLSIFVGICYLVICTGSSCQIYHNCCRKDKKDLPPEEVRLMEHQY